MKIGVPKESKDNEYRVGVTPDGVRQLAAAGHELLVERGAGAGSGFGDERYQAAGARCVDVEEAWSAPDLVVKVKEPNDREVARLRAGQTLFTYLHLAPNRALTEGLLAADVVAIAYETIQSPDGTFPVLAPMSEVAGRLAVQIGVTLLQKDRGGKGVLVGGVPGVPRGRVGVIGAGIVGINAARVAHALGAEVTVLDVDLKRLTYLYDLFHGELNTLFSNRINLERAVAESDLLVGAVYLRGRRAPRLVSDAMVRSMEPGSVIADVAVDQGGCIETIRPTTHSDPTYLVHGVIHYGVANMPAAVPRTSTFALTNTTLPFLERLAELGAAEAVRGDASLALGANVWRGEVVCEGVGEAHGLPVRPLEAALGSVSPVAGAPGAVACFSFDNLGEAADVGAGRLDGPRAPGEDASLAVGYPRLFALLERQRVRASFFVEGWNGEQHPEAVREIVARGHELGAHGWLHEPWSSLDPEREAELARRMTDALARAAGAPPQGFRAPGGARTATTEQILLDLGYRFDASLGDGMTPARLPGGLAQVPFTWAGVDGAFYLRPEPAPPEVVRDAWLAALGRAAGRGGLFVLVCHAFLTGVEPARVAALEAVIEAARRDPRVAIRTVGEVAAALA